MIKYASAVSLVALLAASPALAADVYKGMKDEHGVDVDYRPSRSWTGPWGAVLGGYSIGTLTEGDGDSGLDNPGLSVEGGFIQGELGYDYQLNGRLVIGAYICGSYSAIEGLADGYCAQGRFGVLVSRDSLLYANAGWRWQGTDEDGEDSVYGSGPVAGFGLESRWTEHLAVKVGFEHHWITDIDGETVPDEIDLGDNRIMAGFVFRY